MAPDFGSLTTEQARGKQLSSDFFGENFLAAVLTNMVSLLDQAAEDPQFDLELTFSSRRTTFLRGQHEIYLGNMLCRIRQARLDLS